MHPKRFADAYYESVIEAAKHYPAVPESNNASFDWMRLALFSHYPLVIRSTKTFSDLSFAVTNKISSDAIEPIYMRPDPTIDL